MDDYKENRISAIPSTTGIYVHNVLALTREELTFLEEMIKLVIRYLKDEEETTMAKEILYKVTEAFFPTKIILDRRMEE